MTKNERRTVDFVLQWLDEARCGDVMYGVALERRAYAALKAMREGKSPFAAPRPRKRSA